MPVLQTIASMLPIVGQAVSSIGERAQERRNIQDTFRHQKQMAEYQYSKDLEMWERANRYNEPTQQMQRLRDAGLNPAMIYGSGGAKTTAASQLPKYQAPRPDYSARQSPLEFMSALSIYQDVQMKNEQIDILKEQKKIKAAEANIKMFDTDRWLSRMSETKWENGRLVTKKGAKRSWYIDAQMDAAIENVRRMNAQIQSLDASRQLKQKEIEFYNWNKIWNPLIGKALSFLGPLGKYTPKNFGKRL